METKTKGNAQRERASVELRLSRMVVVDETDPKKMILVAMYGLGGGEKFVAGLTRIEQGYADSVHSGVGKYAFVQGSGDKFVLPDTRLEVNDCKFWSGVLDGYVTRAYAGAQFRPAMVNTLAKQCYVSRVQRIGGFEGSQQFTVLTRDETRKFRDARKPKSSRGEDQQVSFPSGKGNRYVAKQEASSLGLAPASSKVVAQVKDAKALKVVAEARAQKSVEAHVHLDPYVIEVSREESSEDEASQTYSSEDEEDEETLIAEKEGESEGDEQDLLTIGANAVPLTSLLTKEGFLPSYVIDPERSFVNKLKWSKLKDDVLVVESWVLVRPGDETHVVGPSPKRRGQWRVSEPVKWTTSGNALMSPDGSKYALLK